MHFLTTTAALLATLTSVSASIQVNYYSDGGCSDYLLSLYNVPNSDTCYDYAWGDQNSANIAACGNKNTCYCTFYTESYCKGVSQALTYGKDNCASNYGHGFKSFRCLEQPTLFP
ncbi:hypothetical protein BJX70DRAFT_365424 [Aspergillus crustosus]